LVLWAKAVERLATHAEASATCLVTVLPKVREKASGTTASQKAKVRATAGKAITVVLVKAKIRTPVMAKGALVKEEISAKEIKEKIAAKVSEKVLNKGAGTAEERITPPIAQTLGKAVAT